MMKKEQKEIVSWGPRPRIGLLALTAYLVLLTFPIFLSSAVAQNGPPLVHSIDAVGMTVSDLDRSIAFFTKVLSFEKVSQVEVYGTPYEQLVGVFGARMKVARLRLGEEYIELTEYLTPGGQPISVDSRSNDLWFQHIAIVVRDMDQAYRHLRKYNVQHVSTAPQRIPDWNKAAAGVKAFYFRDPDGHNLELIYFPPDKGDPKWQRPTDNLFLGIDHTAIGISDTGQSLQFYRDLLGLEVAGESLNYGTEQEHLANVFGARVHITGLRSRSGTPGVEFLDYLAPPGGRSMRVGVQSHDIVHWQTTFVVKDIQTAAEHLRAGDARFVSSGVVTLPNGSLGFTKALLVRGPDGHALRLVQR